MSRVALDLHDGPVQDIALLRGELARLHGKLDPAGSGCLEDLMSVAEAAEADLREMAVSLESTSLGRRPLVEALNGAARAFALRSGIEPELTISGDASGLTSMERVAVMRVVGEALANVREHSGARTVAVRVAIGEREVTAAIRDDGRGFDLDHALPDAARRGRLGLLGMIERMRLLDGVCAITSEPGAGTTVALRFERFFDAARETGEAPATVRSA
jgi:signal transduction histidine kinase